MIRALDRVWPYGGEHGALSSQAAVTRPTCETGKLAVERFKSSAPHHRPIP